MKRRTRVPRTVPVGQLRRTLENIRRFRVNFVFGTVLVLFAVLIGRLAKLQLFEGENYQNMASKRHDRRVTFKPMRGKVMDRFGWALSVSRPYRTVMVDTDPSVLTDVHVFSLQTSALLGGEPSAFRIRNLIEQARLPKTKEGPGRTLRGRRHVTLRRRVEDATTMSRLDTFRALAIREKRSLGLYGLVVELNESRVWPNGHYAIHAVGRPPVKGSGSMHGVEVAADRWLSGEAARVSVKRDALGRPMATGDAEGRLRARGKDIRTTLDLYIQHRVETELDEIVRAFGSDTANGPRAPAIAVVMDIHTGEILACASRPAFDPNVRIAKGGLIEGRVDLVTQGRFEFGSVHKPFTVAWALQHGIIQPHTTIPMPGTVRFGRAQPISDTHPIGDGTLVLLIAESSNTGSAWLGHRLGAQRMQALWNQCRFGEPTGIGFPYEKAGRVAGDGLTTRGAWVDWLAERFAFGQGAQITPLQLVSAYAALARDDAQLIRPTLALRKKVRDPRRGQLVDPKHLGPVREGLRACVTHGTLASVFDGCPWAVAGKTGTAQSVIRGVQYNICSVAAYAPAERPQFVVLVSARVERNRGSGARVAGPAVRRIIESTLGYWGVPTHIGATVPTTSTPRGVAPSLRPPVAPTPEHRALTPAPSRAPAANARMAQDVREIWERTQRGQGAPPSRPARPSRPEDSHSEDGGEAPR